MGLILLAIPGLACQAVFPDELPALPRATPTQPLPAYPRQSSTAAAGVTPVSQEAALLPAARSDLSELSGVPRYAIQVEIDFTSGAFSGLSLVEVTNQESTSLESLYFRLLPNAQKSYGNGWLEVTRIALDGQVVAPELSVSDTVLKISLPAPLPAGGSARIDFEFQGQVALDFGGDAEPAGYGIYNLSQGVLALSGWYPILAVYDADGWNLDPVSAIGDSVYSDTALYSVDVTAPQNLMIATTGVQVGTVDQGARTLHQYLSGPARDFFLVMSPDFSVIDRLVDGTRVGSYYLPGHEQAAQKALDVAADSLQTFNQRFGVYPYVELDVVEAPMRYALGVEYPGVFLIASDLYTKPQEVSFTTAVAHETAHQWWYGLVGNDVFADPWLDEGLATYTSSLYFEETGGMQAYHGFTGYLEEHYQDLRADGQDDMITQSLDYFERLDRPRVYGGVVYTKGALFFAALRDEIGDTAFFAALQDYYQDYKYGVASPEDLLASFDLAAGHPLDAFYEEWLYQVQK